MLDPVANAISKDDLDYIKNSPFPANYSTVYEFDAEEAGDKQFVAIAPYFGNISSYDNYLQDLVVIEIPNVPIGTVVDWDIKWVNSEEELTVLIPFGYMETVEDASQFVNYTPPIFYDENFLWLGMPGNLLYGNVHGHLLVRGYISGTLVGTAFVSLFAAASGVVQDYIKLSEEL